MNRVMVSGVTGFLGSAIAASFLKSGKEVHGLTRNDETGQRARQAVLSAARGFGWDISEEIRRGFHVVNVDFMNMKQNLLDKKLPPMDAIWHVAAEMSYLSQKLSKAFQVNVNSTMDLYEFLVESSSSKKRFYYVSTAYVAGMQGGIVKERLHSRAELINTYQVTKWSAEQALHLGFLDTGVPVTLFRPSVVVGHRQTGWALRNGFGFYMFLEAMLRAANAGCRDLLVDLEGSARPDLVTVDQVVGDALALTGRPDQPCFWEVFHCSGGVNENIESLVGIWARAAGLQAAIGLPVTNIDRMLNKAISLNRPFANQEWLFDRRLLDKAVGRDSPVPPLQYDELTMLCEKYASEVAEASRYGVRS